MHQLLIQDGKARGYSYEPVSGAGGDGGIDGWVAQGLPEFKGAVAFQFKWLWEDIHKGSKKAQIQDSLQRAASHSRGPAQWVLVTPWDLKQSERDWLAGLGASSGLQVHHWGRAHIENLLRGFPALFARYYPHEAQALPGGQGSVQFKEFAGRYRQKMELAYRHLRLLGLPPETLRERDSRKDVPLRDLFVPLKFVRQEGGDESVQSLQEMLRSGRSTVVLGDPGTGKTTLLSFISLLLLGKADLPEYSAHTGAVPLLIPLRQFMRAGGQRAGFSFIDYLVAQARSDHALKSAHPFFFEAALRMEEAFVLFDGLDEVGSASTRRRIAGMINAFRAEYPGCPIWVTSRIYGYTPDVRLPEGDFQHARLGRLDDSQVTEFIRRWYALQLSDNERERQDATESLLKAVQHTPSVYGLARNPLLLTLMAFIHQGLRKLPQDRGELYEKCVEMLLKTWQEARNDGEAVAHMFARLGLHIQTQKDYLAHLALQVQEKNQEGSDEESRGLISRRDALEILTARHLVLGRRERPGMTVGEAREEMGAFLDYISDQTGLLIDRGGGQLSFIHLSFQEYLAAWVFTCQPKEHDNLKFFSIYMGRPAWEEVLLLRLYIILCTPGGGGAQDFDAIVAEIRRKLEQSGSPLGWLTLIRALRDNLKFSPTDRDAILEKGIETWSESPADAEIWFTAMEEVKLFSSGAKERLQELLDDACQQERPVRAIACLHLRTRLFGWPEDGVSRLRRNPWLLEMLPDLVAFLDESGVKGLLDKQAVAADWYAALAGLEGRRSYFLTLDWAMGFHSPDESALRAAVAKVGSKVIEDLKSRKDFAASHSHSDASCLFKQPGSILAVWDFYAVASPLSGVQSGTAVPSLARITARALCHPMLSHSRFEERMWPAPAAEAALSRWADKQISALLRPFHSPSADIQSLADTFIRTFVRPFGNNFVRNFIRVFHGPVVRAFVRDYGRDYGRDFVRAFVRAYGRDYGRDYSRGRVFEFIGDFMRDFGYDHALDYGRDYVRALVHRWSSFELRIIVGIDPHTPDGNQNWDQALADKETLATVLRSDSFWFKSSSSGANFDVDLEPGKRTTELKNPFALPLLMADTFGTGLVNYLYSLGRHLAVVSPGDAEWAQAAEEWIRQNPLDVYAVAFAWEECAQLFQSQRGRLAGAAGALMLTHAAYARLMTGLPCEGPVWTWLVEARDQEDSLIQAAYLLHEIAHFRDVEKNVQAWESLSVKILPDVPSRSAQTLRGSSELEGASSPTQSAAAAHTPGRGPAREPEPLFAWVHLSDIHMGHGGAGHRADQQLVLSSLERDLSAQRTRVLPRVDALLVTGDIAFSGEPAQYAEAGSWLLRLAEGMGLGARDVYTVPGNHDVRRAVDKERQIARMVRALREGTESLDEVLAHDEDRALLARRMADYLAFAARFAPAGLPGRDHSLLASWGHRLTARAGLSVRLVGLNTALLAADSQDKGRLRLGQRAIASTLSTNLEDNELVLVLSHHPLRSDWLHDGREADRWLKGRAHIHLFGHVHEPDLEESRAGSGQQLARIAAGAVHGEKPQEGVPGDHGYSLAAIYPHKDREILLRVWPRRWSGQNTDFRADVHNLPKERDCAEHVIAGIKLTTPA